MITEEHGRYRDDIAVYLLGALGEDEARDFERHLDECGSCQRELGRLRVAADALPRSVESVVPPRALKRELMKAVRGDRPGVSERLREALEPARFRPAWVVPAAVATLAAGIAIGWAATRPTTRVVSASVGIPGASARLVIPPGAGNGAILRVTGMPTPPPGRIYEVWLLRGRTPLPSSLFSVGASGRGAAAIEGSLRGVTRVLVTSERASGARTPTSAPLIAAGA